MAHKPPKKPKTYHRPTDTLQMFFPDYGAAFPANITATNPIPQIPILTLKVRPK